MLNALTFLLLLCALISTDIFATVPGKQIQSHESILETARNYARQLAASHAGKAKIQIEMGTLDKRLRLSQCSKPLTAFESPNTKNVGRTTVGVRCDGDKSWKLYISVEIQVVEKVVILKQHVTKNAVLQASDLALTEQNVTSLHQGYYTSPQQLIGKYAKNAMQAGAVISPSHVKNPMAIKKGALVTIVADISGIQVRMKGKALKSGALGDWISVRNLSSNRKVEGKITNAGVIQVTL